MAQNLNDVYPIVSVITSVYNGETYLREAIDSILNQTYTHFEFIIINDGSTDRSLEIIKSYTDSRIKLINNDGNKGLIYSLNKGIEMAKGTYIARMDADDISMPERFEKQVKFLENNFAIDICTSDYIQFSAFKERKNIGLSNHDEIVSFLLFNSSLIHPTLLFRKTVFDSDKVWFDKNYIHAEDYELWTRLLLKHQVGKVPLMLFKYRLHDKQITSKYSKQQIQSANSIRENMLLRCGFIFTKDELRVHNIIGSSQLITEVNDLKLLLVWFNKLIENNKKSKFINETIFIKTLNKLWYDACGITNLGLRAFFIYTKSNFKSEYKGNMYKLLIKCVVRYFK